MVSSTVVPGSATLITDSWAYPVRLPSVAVTVIVVVPKLAGSDSDQCPVESALADAIPAAPPVSPDASAVTRAPAAVFPLTLTVDESIRVPSAGELTVSGSEPGIPWAT